MLSSQLIELRVTPSQEANVFQSLNLVDGITVVVDVVGILGRSMVTCHFRGDEVCGSTRICFNGCTAGLRGTALGIVRLQPSRFKLRSRRPFC